MCGCDIPNTQHLRGGPEDAVAVFLTNCGIWGLKITTKNDMSKHDETEEKTTIFVISRKLARD